MNLPSRALRLRVLSVKDQPVLAIDTAVAADSMEGLRLVKASRGSGWLWTPEGLRPWITRGVLQDSGKLVIWGYGASFSEGGDPGAWPTVGSEGRTFIQAFTQAWTSWCTSGEALPSFTPSALLPWKLSQGWAFVIPPPELRGALDSLLPLTERLAWEHLKHPDLSGVASWAFASAALALSNLTDSLPWQQKEEESLRHELRELKRTFREHELPPSLTDVNKRLWFEAITSRTSTASVAHWATWSTDAQPWAREQPDPTSENQWQRALARRMRRRQGSHFWRQRGTVITVASGGGSLVLAVVAMMIWGAIKPDPTDVWSPEQVVRGYYLGLASLDGELLRKVTAFDRGKEPDLSHDQDQATNLFVVRQIRLAYEHKSPVVEAQQWRDLGQPKLEQGQLLYGLVDLSIEKSPEGWTARYDKWVSENPSENTIVAAGSHVVDALTLVSTGRGWKISSLKRKLQPLP